jgi:glycosyltransferase involved in cell wall biosynthesis
MSHTKSARLKHPVRISDQSWSEGTVPVVNIYCPAYNHESFIAETIESFLMQETCFPVQVLIHDDASSDSTVDIIRKYQKKFPYLFNTVFQKQNQLSKGVKPWVFMMPLIRADFMAVCDGDDYWTDPTKLQKQVDFLEAHPGVAFCAHNAAARFSDGGMIPWFANEEGQGQFCGASAPPHEFTFDDYMKSNILPTVSLLFRNVLALSESESFLSAPLGDWFMIQLLLKQGTGAYLPDTMAVYRVHDDGLHMSRSDMERKAIRLVQLHCFSAAVEFDDLHRQAWAKMWKSEFRSASQDPAISGEYLAALFKYIGEAKLWGRIGPDLITHQCASLSESSERVRAQRKLREELLGSTSYKVGKRLVSPFGRVLRQCRKKLSSMSAAG